MELTVGQTLESAVDATKVIVIRAPSGDVAVTCGGVAMFDPKVESPPAGAAMSATGGTQLGKRYVDVTGSLELLCTRNGDGTLARDGVELEIRAPKPLPASD